MYIYDRYIYIYIYIHMYTYTPKGFIRALCKAKSPASRREGHYLTKNKKMDSEIRWENKGKRVGLAGWDSLSVLKDADTRPDSGFQ